MIKSSKERMVFTMSILQTTDLKKYYGAAPNITKALDGVTLSVGQGEFVAIVGTSGSGKSTLLNMIGGLDVPTTGKVTVDGKELSMLNDEQLTIFRRRKIGFIFQNYNLVPVLNVYENILLPIELDGNVPDEGYVNSIIETLGLSRKLSALPNNLSGGQQQRVAIARALASDPKILLCDEATSALDPTTTKSILALLKEINEQYGITIVIITHEMSVVQEICNQVAIIDDGHLVESGNVVDVFSRPRTKAAQKLVFQGERRTAEMRGKRCIRIVFRENSSFEPVIGNMVLACKAPVNILLADTKDIGGIAHGQMVLQLPEDSVTAEKMIQYLKERNLTVEELADYVE